MICKASRACFAEGVQRYRNVFVTGGELTPRRRCGQLEAVTEPAASAERVLVVDDEPDIVALVAYHLAKSAPGKDSYPISSMTWIILYQNQPDRVKGAKLVNFLRWAYKNGEKTAETLDYAPLPASMVARLQSRLNTIRVADGQVGAAR